MVLMFITYNCDHMNALLSEVRGSGSESFRVLRLRISEFDARMP